MELEKVIARIEAESISDAKRILDEANIQKDRMLREAKEAHRKIVERCQRDTEKYLRQLTAREEARTEVEVKKTLLAQEKRILSMAFDKVLADFGRLSDDRKRAIYTALLKSAQSEIPKGTIHCRKGDEKFFSGHPGYRLGENIETAGGFTVENHDGTILLDMRFENILKDIWGRNIRRFADILFSKGADR